jgi:purine-binding chemotaxis protein CheW
VTDRSPENRSNALRNEQKNSSQFVGFQLSDQEYAFRIEQIREIVILKQVTRTPQVPSYVEGVSNLRGKIIPIISLRLLFGLGNKAIDDETRTIVVNVGDRTMGYTVDSVSQVMRIQEENIQPAPDAITSGGANYIGGLANLEDRMIVILEIDELLNPDELERFSPSAIQNLVSDS